jgi:hypothetical protein
MFDAPGGCEAQRSHKRGKTTLKTVKPASDVAPWQKICPNCNSLQHVRKKACGCGHKFAVRARHRTGGGELR